MAGWPAVRATAPDWPNLEDLRCDRCCLGLRQQPYRSALRKSTIIERPTAVPEFNSVRSPRPIFFAKDWPQAELDRLASLEVDGQKVILPWHRVVRADWSIPKGDRQRALLLAEGVPMRGGRVDLKKVRNRRLPR